MTEKTHDLIASKAARLEDLINLAKTGAAASGPVEPGTPNTTSVNDDLQPGPSWTGGGWNN